MGSNTSKTTAFADSLPSSSSSSAGFWRLRSKRSSLFHSSCLSGSHNVDNDDAQLADHQTKKNASGSSCSKHDNILSGQLKAERYRKVKIDRPNEVSSVSSNPEHDHWDHQSFFHTTSSTDTTSSQSFSSRLSNTPGNASFRLGRAATFGSSSSRHGSSRSFIVSNDEDELHQHAGSDCCFTDRKDIPQDCDMLHAYLINRSTEPEYNCFDSVNTQLNSSVFPDNWRDDQITSTQDAARDINTTITGFNVNLSSPRNRLEIRSLGRRLADRDITTQEPVEQNIRFSRTLSVGRLRDRVLRRSSFADLTFGPSHPASEMRNSNQSSWRQAPGGQTGTAALERNFPMSSVSSSYVPTGLDASYHNQDFEVATLHASESRYHDLSVQRSNFLERRRRISSQRFASRFENLSGHVRSCILSGQHRTGLCTCRGGIREGNSRHENSDRASISRIVMLAEALIEVLDEIHQQSVVSSSLSSSFSTATPAPIAVVNSLPVKLYNKLQEHPNEEVAQCYICLVEYEDGDSLRTLPCHHEFHRACIDKWLKEIHGVCPLCRSDICRHNLSLDN